MSTTKEMVEEQLRLLASSCPHDILDNARKLNSDYVHSKDPIVCDLLRLDHAIQVPNNTPYTLKFSAIVFEFVQWLLCLIEDKNYNFKFHAFPVGSYPSNVKIGDIDEFDFLLKWVLTSEVIAAHNLFLKERFHTSNAETAAKKLGFYDLITDIVCNLETVEDCTISGPALSGPAVNLGLKWKCKSGHQHSLGIDLTIAIETSTTLENFLCNKRSDFKYSPFNDPILDRKQNLMSINPGDSSFSAATNLFDEQMFSICDKISRNIKVSYRILKFIRDSLFPYVLQQKIMSTDYQLHDKHEQSISSHYLKQIVFHEVQKFPNGNSWEEKNLVERIISMLTAITDGFDPRDFYGLYSLNVTDFLTHRGFSITEEAYWFTKKVVDKLVSVIKDTTSNESTEFGPDILLYSRTNNPDIGCSISPELEAVDPNVYQQLQNFDCPSQQEKSKQNPHTKDREHTITTDFQFQDQTLTTDCQMQKQFSTADPIIQEQTITTDPMSQEQTLKTDCLMQKQRLTADPLIKKQTITTDPLIQEQTLTAGPLTKGQTLTTEPLIQKQTITTDSMIKEQALTSDPDQMSEAGIQEETPTTGLLIHKQTLTTDPMIQKQTLTTGPLIQNQMLRAGIQKQTPAFEISVLENTLTADPLMQAQMATANPLKQKQPLTPDFLIQDKSSKTEMQKHTLTTAPLIQKQTTKTGIPDQTLRTDPLIQEQTLTTDHLIQKQVPKYGIQEQLLKADSLIQKQPLTNDPLILDLTSTNDPLFQKRMTTTDSLIQEQISTTDHHMKVWAHRITTAPQTKEQMTSTDPQIHEQISTTDQQVQEQTMTTDPLFQGQMPTSDPYMKDREDIITTEPQTQEQMGSTDPQINEQMSTTDQQIQEKNLKTDPLIQELTLITGPLIPEQMPAAGPYMKDKEHNIITDPQIQEQKASTDPQILKRISTTDPQIQEQALATNSLIQEQSLTTAPLIRIQTSTADPLIPKYKITTDFKIHEKSLTTDPLTQETNLNVANGESYICQQKSHLACRIKKQILETENHINLPIKDSSKQTFIPIRNMLFNVEIEKMHFLFRFFGGSKLTYIKQAFSLQKLSRFYFVGRMIACFNDNFRSMHIIDLVNATDEHVRATLMFFKLDILSEDDLKTTKYIKKLQAFDQLIADSGLTSEHVLGQYAGDNHQYKLSLNTQKPWWYDQLSSDLGKVLRGASREAIGMLLRFATRKIRITDLQHIKTEPLQLIAKIHMSLVLKLDTDATLNDGAARVDEIDIDDTSDIDETVEESIRWYCLKHIMEKIRAL